MSETPVEPNVDPDDDDVNDPAVLDDDLPPLTDPSTIPPDQGDSRTENV